MRKLYYFIEISTLFEPRWAGIPTVTKNLCLQFLSSEMPFSFFINNTIVDKNAVQLACKMNTGLPLDFMKRHGIIKTTSVYKKINSFDYVSVGIFPNLKPFHRELDFEVLICHDISFLLMPEFHHENTVMAHSASIVPDIASSDLICCVSNATLNDLHNYLGVEKNKLFVAHLGATINNRYEAEKHALHIDLESFILILGTMEPRKNISLVLQMLQMRPEILETYSFVFVGKYGWGPSFEQQLIDLGLAQEPRIIHLDYVSDDLKFHLLGNCAFSIYPSIFEGFGLPVIEAMWCGCPILVSRSSSLVELGVQQEHTFDPFSVADLFEKFSSFMNSDADTMIKIGKKNKLIASKFTWERFFTTIVGNIQEKLQKN